MCGHAYSWNQHDWKKSEKAAEKKLSMMRKALLDEDPVIVTAPHYDKLHKLLNSELHHVFKLLPKPVVHHAHLSGCVDVDLLIRFTYYDYVYYSQKENKFHVNKISCTKPGYIRVNKLRQYAASSKDFDKTIEEKILLQINHREDNNIWKDF